MHLLIVIGAGASFDTIPTHVDIKHDDVSIRLPLANNLFSPFPTQDSFLEKFNLMGLASTLRTMVKTKGKDFDVEEELAVINDKANERKDMDTQQSLFKARFYLHSVIRVLAQKTLDYTHSHTIYVDLLSKLKDWIYESPSSRFVEIVVFNYDDLVERAMEHVYNYTWNSKNKNDPLSAYYNGKNLKIYKPHGSINWGRKVVKNESDFSYLELSSAFDEFNNLEITNYFQFIDPSFILSANERKTYIPAIAVPFKGKRNFEECPQEMQAKMLEAVNNADKIITLGWKGADENFIDLLKGNKKIDEIYVVSLRFDTNLTNVYSREKFKPYESTFKYFVSDSPTLETILNEFDKK